MAQMQDQQERATGWAEIVAQTWQNPPFRQRVLTDPSSVLRERGIELPAGVQVRVVEDTDETIHLVLPPPPGELSDEQLDELAGGLHPDLVKSSNAGS